MQQPVGPGTCMWRLLLRYVLFAVKSHLQSLAQHLLSVTNLYTARHLYSDGSMGGRECTTSRTLAV